MTHQTLDRILNFVGLHYGVDRLLRDSGQRMVYLGINRANNTRVAIKTCKYAEAGVARIQREIKILQSFNTPYFPTFDISAYITKENLREFIDGFDPKTDQQLIHELERENLRPFFLTVEEYIEHLPWDQVSHDLADEKRLIDFMLHIFRAMGMLWAKKIVHRDIKPDNILVRPDFTPTLIDLGIAKSLEDGATKLTAPFCGSPCTYAYASPEQLVGPSENVVYKSDQFSLGVVLFQILMGELPFGNPSEAGIEETVRRMATNERKSLGESAVKISPALATLIDRLLEFEPYKRFRTVESILEQLTSIKGNPQ